MSLMSGGEMNKATTYNLPSVAVIGCRLVLLAILSWSCLPSVLRMVCIKSNAMLKHCGGSPKWLEAQSLQGTLHDGLAMTLFFVLFSFGNEFVHVA